MEKKNLQEFENQQMLDSDDILINSSSPPRVEDNMYSYHQFQIKLVLKEDVIIAANESVNLDSICFKNETVRDYSIRVEPVQFPHFIHLENEKSHYISQKYRGRISIRCTNFSDKNISLQSGRDIGTMFFMPFDK